MVLTIHHLGVSQSERIIWLCEELGISYNMIKYDRDPTMAPKSLKAVPGNATGKAPFMDDSETGVQLSESGAICDYIIHRHGNGKLAISPTDDAKKYADYLYWFHFANGSLQPAMITAMFLTGLPDDNMMKAFANGRLNEAFQVMDDHLKGNKWLAGSDFTAADIMTLYCLTTQRYFGPQVSLKPYPNVVRYMNDCAKREGFERAMKKGDPEMKVLLTAEAPSQSMLGADGINSTFWKK